MNGFMPVNLTSQIFYLERSLKLLKQKIVLTTEKAMEKTKHMYGSLPNLKLSFPEMDSVRKKLSVTWEREWS